MGNSGIRRKNKLIERAQAIKDKLDKILLLRKKNKNSLFNSNNNIDNNNNKYSFYDINRRKTPFIKRRIENELKLENPYLKNLLGKIPKHEKDKRKIRQSDDNYNLVFTNGFFRKRSDSIDNKKFTGNSSMIMPPNKIYRND